MTATTDQSPLRTHRPEKALALALRLSHAESALHALTSGQVDAIIDPDGKAYLLRPAQEHLRQNEKRLQAVLDSTADVITVVDRGGMILSQSRAVTRVLGYQPEELVGGSIFGLVHDEDLARIYSAFFNVIEEFRTDAQVAFRHRTCDGSYRLIEAAVARLSDGSSVGAVFSLRPINSQPQERTDPDTLPASENREFMILSHGRRIPLMGTWVGIEASDT